MKKAKRILCALLALTMALSMAGCKGGSNSAENGEEVTLTWVMQGPGNQTDSERVWEKVNEDLKTYNGLENVNLEMVIIPGSDYRQKVMLMQTSEEKMDILGTYGLSFQDEVQKNDSFIPLDDLIKKYAPDITKEIPDWVMDLTKIDGVQYTIPNYQQMSMPMWGYKFNKNDAEKYLDMEALNRELDKSDILSEGILNVLEDYMLKLKEAGKLNLGFKPVETWVARGYGYTNNSISYPYRYNGDKVVVETLIGRDVYKMYSKKMTEFYKKGLIRKDVLSAELSQGEYDVQLTQYHKYVNQNINNGLPEDEQVIVIPTEKNFYGPTSSGAGGNGITTLCENPVEAMKLLDLMYTKKGQDLYRTLVYGFEGEHYNKISDDRIEATGYSTTQDGKYGLSKWLVGNTAQAYETLADPEGWNDYVFNDWNANMVPSKLVGLQFDTSKIQTKYEQVASVMGSYNNTLMGGSVEDWDATYKEAIQKMEVAGVDVVIDELQRQVDEFLGQ